MRSTITTNVLLLSILAFIVGSVLFFTMYAVPVYITIVHEANVEMAREYRAAEEVHAQQWQYMLDKFFVLRCNTDQAETGE